MTLSLIHTSIRVADNDVSKDGNSDERVHADHGEKETAEAIQATEKITKDPTEMKKKRNV